MCSRCVVRRARSYRFCFFFFQAEDGIRDYKVTGVQTCALPISSHHSPEPGCTCGIHAVKDPARLARAGRSTAVVGRVAIWGRVIEHSKGYRAELAYPSRLALVCAWCLWRGRMPAAPDRVVQRGAWLRPACAEHSRRPTAVGRSTPANDVLQELLDTYGVDRLPAEMFRPLDERRPGDLVTRFLRATDR